MAEGSGVATSKEVALGVINGIKVHLFSLWTNSIRLNFTRLEIL